jgi:hypothetical protein
LPAPADGATSEPGADAAAPPAVETEEDGAAALAAAGTDEPSAAASAAGDAGAETEEVSATLAGVDFATMGSAPDDAGGVAVDADGVALGADGVEAAAEAAEAAAESVAIDAEGVAIDDDGRSVPAAVSDETAGPETLGDSLAAGSVTWDAETAPVEAAAASTPEPGADVAACGIVKPTLRGSARRNPVASHVDEALRRSRASAAAALASVSRALAAAVSATHAPTADASKAGMSSACAGGFRRTARPNGESEVGTGPGAPTRPCIGGKPDADVLLPLPISSSGSPGAGVLDPALTRCAPAERGGIAVAAA